MVKIIALSMYSRTGASSRLRMMQYFPLLDDASFCVMHVPLISDEMLVRRYKEGRYRIDSLLVGYVNRIRHLMQRQLYDVVWIEKEALPWMPLWLELKLLDRIPYVLDYDDAVFHNYDLHPSSIIRFFLSGRIDGLMAKASLVIAGNPYIASRALKAGARRIEVVPTVIDLDRYRFAEACIIDNKIPRIVWIGSPSTVKYLAEISSVFMNLAKTFQFTLRVIGATLQIPGVNIECISWSEDTEVDAIMGCDIGIMPLHDSQWELGKCGYKLIQYMASALPVVASPIGVNLKIVRDGHNGFLASGVDFWIDRLGKLLSDRTLRTGMGISGRKDVEEIYCIQRQGPKIVTLLRDTAGGHF